MDIEIIDVNMEFLCPKTLSFIPLVYYILIYLLYHQICILIAKHLKGKCQNIIIHTIKSNLDMISLMKG